MVQRSTSPTTAVFTASTQVVRRDPSEFQYVKLTIDKNVARITLLRPDHNLLNESMLREIADAILTAGETETLHAPAPQRQRCAFAQPAS